MIRRAGSRYGRLVRLQHPLTAQPSPGLGFTALLVPRKASGRRAGTAVAFLLPWLYTRNVRVQ